MFLVKLQEAHGDGSHRTDPGCSADNGSRRGTLRTFSTSQREIRRLQDEPRSGRSDVGWQRGCIVGVPGVGESHDEGGVEELVILGRVDAWAAVLEHIAPYERIGSVELYFLVNGDDCASWLVACSPCWRVKRLDVKRNWTRGLTFTPARQVRILLRASSVVVDSQPWAGTTVTVCGQDAPV